MTDKKYDYFYNSMMFRAADGIVERYEGNGVWEKSEFDPYAAIDPNNKKWDFDDAIRMSPSEVDRCMKMQDEELERRQNGFYDD